MKAGPEIIGDEEEVIGSLGAIPVGPFGRDELNGTSEHARRFERQGKAVWE